ncbi:serine/arginine repetitive matrix protein 1 [Dermacentor albipictus]|uniref:serine/arginine repetitive matrix protein 1 n=1 Tax=Dermacentor albipictus TaxID=60249 RepID=UPI0031FCBA38
MKVIIRPTPGLIVRKLQTHQVAKAIVQATGGAPTCKGDDFIVRLRHGSNIIIVSTPHEATAATLIWKPASTTTPKTQRQPRPVTHSTKAADLRPRWFSSEREGSDFDYSESPSIYGSRSGSNPRSRSRSRSCSRPRSHFRSPRRRSRSTPKQGQQAAPAIAVLKDKGPQQHHRKTKEASVKRNTSKEHEGRIGRPAAQILARIPKEDPEDFTTQTIICGIICGTINSGITGNLQADRAARGFQQQPQQPQQQQPQQQQPQQQWEGRRRRQGKPPWQPSAASAAAPSPKEGPSTSALAASKALLFEARSKVKAPRSCEWKSSGSQESMDTTPSQKANLVPRERRESHDRSKKDKTRTITTGPEKAP